MFKRLFKNYVSELDRFLMAFDREEAMPSESRRQEEEKHARIAVLRDDRFAKIPTKIWKD